MKQDHPQAPNKVDKTPSRSGLGDDSSSLAAMPRFLGVFSGAEFCLAIGDPFEKCQATRLLWQQELAGELVLDEEIVAAQISQPGRPQKPELVEPLKVPRRRLGSPDGRAALVHAIAHIEFNAINLALDAAYRFRGLPRSYYSDWLSVAADEARHFELLVRRLGQLGFVYGDFPAHNGLWEMAAKTADSCLRRMALVPRVLEARGLDVTPGMIKKMEQLGDQETIAVLEIILAEEVRHVEIGTRWFRYCCDLEGLEPEATFINLLSENFSGNMRGPFNLPARYAAGFTRTEMDAIGGLGS